MAKSQKFNFPRRRPTRGQRIRQGAKRGAIVGGLLAGVSTLLVKKQNRNS
jgi:hypothetical protein